MEISSTGLTKTDNKVTYRVHLKPITNFEVAVLERVFIENLKIANFRKFVGENYIEYDIIFTGIK